MKRDKNLSGLNVHGLSLVIDYLDFRRELFAVKGKAFLKLEAEASVQLGCLGVVDVDGKIQGRVTSPGYAVESFA